MAELADYLDLTVSRARQQFRELKLRSPVSSGRQAVFLPVETLLCLAVSFQINHRRFGGSTTHLAPEPIPSLACLFSRPPSSILARRIAACLDALVAGTVISLEDGCPVT